jgi:hypothetical protein
VFAFVLKSLGGAFFLLMISAVARSRHIPWLFEVIAGALILTDLTYVLGRNQTYWTYRYARDSSGISGSIAYAHWLRVRISIGTVIGFAALYAFLLVLFDLPFLFGGAAGNLALAVYLRRYSRKR